MKIPSGEEFQRVLDPISKRLLSIQLYTLQVWHHAQGLIFHQTPDLMKASLQIAGTQNWTGTLKCWTVIQMSTSLTMRVFFKKSNISWNDGRKKNF